MMGAGGIMLKLILIGLVALLVVGSAVLWMLRPGGRLPEGSAAPDFSLQDQEGRTHRLGDYAGRWLVLYFYPKDDTPGCTKEACAFRDNFAQLDRLDAKVFGISRDDAARHVKFKEKFNLNFPLLSDLDGSFCEAFGVWKLRNMYGKEFMGIERSTFLVGKDGKIAKAWRKVDVEGHVGEVVKEIEALKG
jgi:peroxiredoxin Q/BCP